MATQLALQRNFVTITPSNQITSTTTQSNQSTTTMASSETNGDIVTISDANQVSSSETNSAPIHIMQTHTQVKEKINRIFTFLLVVYHSSNGISLLLITISGGVCTLSLDICRKNTYYKPEPLRMAFRLLMLYQLIKPIRRMKRQSLYQPFCRRIQLPHRRVAQIHNKSPLKLPSYKRRTQPKFLNRNRILSRSMVSFDHK